MTSIGDVAPGLRAPQVDARPNPFNPSTVLFVQMPREATVKLTIHDHAGRVVRTLLADEPLGVGEQPVAWDGRDHQGHAVASGVYFYRLESDVGRAQGKLALVK